MMVETAGFYSKCLSSNITKAMKTRKLCYRKDDCMMRLIYEFWLVVVNPNVGDEVIGGHGW